MSALTPRVRGLLAAVTEVDGTLQLPAPVLADAHSRWSDDADDASLSGLLHVWAALPHAPRLREQLLTLLEKCTAARVLGRQQEAALASVTRAPKSDDARAAFRPGKRGAVHPDDALDV